MKKQIAMIRSIISLILLLISAGLSFKHGWDTFTYSKNPQTLKMLNELGIPESIMPFFGILAFTTGILLLIPKTFFAGNLLNAITIVFIMALALRAGNYKMTFIEIPFLALPLILIWLKYPFRN